MVSDMGLRNAPSIHQQRVIAALCPFLGKFCHVYLDDIAVWSNSVDEHTKHLRMILQALWNASLYFNPKKCDFYLLELDFLGHHISMWGIEANMSKVDRVLKWPIPQNTMEVHSFLGLDHYIATYLPKLAKHTCVLTPLMMKEACKNFPEWTEGHQWAFNGIKVLVVSHECLTTNNHNNMGENKIYVTCDASDWWTGATLRYGPTWEMARPVAFDLMQLKVAEKNYPIHEKELLVIICALKKWWADLLEGPIYMYTDHRTLKNFETQKELSCWQLRWQEYISQYEMTIVYIWGEDNTVADALLWVAPDSFNDEKACTLHVTWQKPLGAILSVKTDASVVKAIMDGYKLDPFCRRLASGMLSIPEICKVNGLWYMGNQLVIPKVGELWKNLFWLAHDCTGHFGADKTYAMLCNKYYWPNMWKELEEGYILGCESCQQNKASTKRSMGPLHLLPVPEGKGDSVTIDFIRPLPPDEGHDCILTMTDHLAGADMWIIPTWMNISTEEFARLFFTRV
jgi:hypothetical protein